MIPGYTLRQLFIDEGVLRPGCFRLPLVVLPPGTPICRLDEAGKAAAQVHIRQGRNGALIMPAPYHSPPKGR